MNRRLVPVIGALLATFTVGGGMIGSPIIALGGLVAVVLFLLVVAVAQRRSAIDPAWSKPPVPQSVGTPVHDRGAQREIGRALGAVESRELLYSPWFAIGLGLLLVIFVGFSVAGSDLGNGPVWMQTVHLAPWFAHPLAGLTIIAVFRAVTRSKRDDTDELFDGCPTGRDVRTGAQLRTMIVPVGAFAVFLVMYFAVTLARYPSLHGPVTWGFLPIVLTSMVLLVGAVYLGTALGVWLPYGVVPIVAVVAVGMVSLGIRSDGDPGWNGRASLSTFGPESDSPMLIALTAPWAYLAWMAALTTIVAVIALARYTRRRGVWITGATGVVVALVASSFAVRPVAADSAADVADLILRPSAHQTCATTTNQAISVCTFDDYPELRARVVDDLRPLADELKGLIGPMTVRQVYDGSITDLPEAVRGIVGPELPELPADEVGIGFGADRDALLADRLAVALWALDTPHTRGDDVHPESVAAQARGVLALWLAARGLDADEAIRLASVDESDSPDDAYGRGYAWPSGCAPVVWSAQDLRAARTVLTLPGEVVRDVLRGDPGRWSDPATTTDELMETLGLDPVGPFDVVEARAEDYC